MAPPSELRDAELATALEQLPPLNGSPLLDPWRIRLRLQLLGQLPEPERRRPTRSEQRLWELLADEGKGWMREYATGPYRLDFYLPSARLAVEVDGSSHWGRRQAERDALRDVWHAVRGITTLRFSADEVERHASWVLTEIRRHVAGAVPEQRSDSDMTPARRCETVLPHFDRAVDRLRRLFGSARPEV